MCLSVCLSVCTWIPVAYVSLWLIDRPEGISDVLVYHILLYCFEMGSLSSKVWHSWIPGFNPEQHAHIQTEIKKEWGRNKEGNWKKGGGWRKWRKEEEREAGKKGSEGGRNVGKKGEREENALQKEKSIWWLWLASCSTGVYKSTMRSLVCTTTIYKVSGDNEW